MYYVEALIGDRTVNTLPPATFAAYRDHGKPALPASTTAIAGRGSDPPASWPGWASSSTRSPAALEVEGVKSFAASFESLLAVIEKKAAALV